MRPTLRILLIAATSLALGTLASAEGEHGLDRSALPEVGTVSPEDGLAAWDTIHTVLTHPPMPQLPCGRGQRSVMGHDAGARHNPRHGDQRRRQLDRGRYHVLQRLPPDVDATQHRQPRSPSYRQGLAAGPGRIPVDRPNERRDLRADARSQPEQRTDLCPRYPHHG